MDYATVATFVLPPLLFLGFVSWRRRVEFRRKYPNTPPCISGHIPWLGCGVDFGKAPLTFINATREKLGDVFTIHAAGKRMTFLLDPDDLPTFMQSDALDFQKAVQPFTSNAAGLPADSFTQSHRALHDMVKGKLAAGKLAALGNEVLDLFEDKLHHHIAIHTTGYPMETGPEWRREPGNTGNIAVGVMKVNLYNLVQSVMFDAVVESLFGEQCTKGVKDIDEFRKTFERYDLDFEYGAELPPIFVPTWWSCKTWLVELMKNVVDNMPAPSGPDHKNNLLEDLVQNVDKSSAHNYALLLLWASQANAIPAVFWTLSFLHQPENRQWLEKARAEADAMNFTSRSGFTEDDLKKLTFIQWCVLEAVRLRSPGMITRKAVKSLKVKDYIIPEGDFVMTSPFWLHRNEKNFPDSEAFLPERWQSADIAKNAFLPGYIAFGGGRYQCPGRWFALMEMQLVVALFLYYYDFELASSVPKESTLHLVGTQQPARPCYVKVDWRGKRG